MTALVRARLLAFVTLLLHLVVAGAVPLADAHAEQGSRVVAAHVESPDTTGCPAVHDHLDCALCRVIAGGSGELPLPQPRDADLATRVVEGAAPTPSHPGADHRGPGARAPPLG